MCRRTLVALGPEPQPEPAAEAPADEAAILKLPQNPEMTALLRNLAKYL